jgi:hypothetical protein
MVLQSDVNGVNIINFFMLNCISLHFGKTPHIKRTTNSTFSATVRRVAGAMSARSNMP